MDWRVDAASLFFGTLPPHSHWKTWIPEALNEELHKRSALPQSVVTMIDNLPKEPCRSWPLLSEFAALFSKTLLLRMAFQNVLWFRQPLNLDLIDTTGLPWFLLWMFKDLKAHLQLARLPNLGTGKWQDTHPMTQLGMGLLALQPTSEFGKVGTGMRHEPPILN